MAIIEVSEVSKSYAGRSALADVTLSVDAGEVFGIMGPNGAGKTTLVEIIEGLRAPDAGSVRVLGLDPRAERRRLNESLGVQLQHTQLPDNLKVAEALKLYASFYRAPADWPTVMRTWGLAELAGRRVGKLSGGQKQRLFIALALVGDPDLVVLDELTTGLDPGARRETLSIVRRVRDSGVTVVLISHFMEEIEALCDRVAVLSQGRVVAVDTPAALAARVDARTLDGAFEKLTGGIES
ncbi:ABC transporter ATP-binding protein [Microbacterium hibisci]|uniref:ABC transporter ATP-binding protein n=1 Tax=Microbacterium hibisci TaxID=2036000 RepID=UPI0019428D74|nr:ABC transporter ATP-binding protein [Microbacterium hibisci]